MAKLRCSETTVHVLCFVTCTVHTCTHRKCSSIIDIKCMIYKILKPYSKFQYVKRLRDQMLASRDMTNIPVIVAANKCDLLNTPSEATKTSSSSTAASTTANQTSASSKELANQRKEIVHVVKKVWCCSHIECSAKYNWNVVEVFKELAVMLDMIAKGQVIGMPHTQTKKRRCLMF